MAVRINRVIAWLTVAVGGLIALVLLGGMAVLQTPPARQWLAQQIKQAAGQALGAELTFDELGGSILGGLRVRNVALSKDGRPLVTAGELSLAYSLFALLGDELEISSVMGRDVWVDLPGVSGLGGGGSGGDSDFALKIKRIILNNAALRSGGMMGPVSEVSGIKLRGGLIVEGGKVSVDGFIDQSQWSLEDIAPKIGLSGQAELDGDKLVLAKLKLTGGEANVQGGVIVDWTSTVVIKGNIRARGLDRAGLPWPSHVPTQAGDADIEVDGPFNAMDIKIAWPALKADVKGHLGLVGEECTLEKVEFKAPWGALTGGMQCHLGKGLAGLKRAEVRFVQMCPPPFLNDILPKWAAGVQLSGQALLDRKDGRLSLGLSLGNCCLASGVDLPGLQVSCRLDGEAVGLDSMDADLGWGQLSASGTFDADRADIELTLTTSDLVNLALAAKAAGLLENAGYHGQATLKARMAGPWRNPAIKAQIQCRELQTPNLIASFFEFKADIKDPAGRPTGAFLITAEDLISGDVDLASAQIKYTRLPDNSRLDFQMTGKSLTAGGTLQHETGAWLPENSTLSGLDIWNEDVGRWQQDGKARLSISSGGFAVSGLQMGQNGQKAWLDGKVDLAGPVDAQLRLQDIAVATFQSVTGGSVARGKLTGRASLSGKLDSPVAVISGVVDEIGGPHLPDCDFRFQGRYGEDQLELNGEVVAQGKPLLTFTAQLGLEISLRPPVVEPTDKGMTARLWADKLPLAALSGYLPWIYNPKGMLSVSVDCRGSWDAPNLSGQLSITDASFIIPQTGQGPRHININLELQDRTIHIRQFKLSAAIDDSPLELSGEIQLPRAQKGSYDLHLGGPDVKISLGELGWVRMAVDLALKGPLDQPELSGKIEPFKAFIRYHMLSAADMEEVVIMRPGQEPPPIGHNKSQWRPTGWLGSLAVDAAIDLNRGLRIDIKDGWFSLSGAMTIKKQAGEWISYGGKIKLVNGLILIYGRRVQLVRGVLDFGYKQNIDPDMDLEAKLKMGSIEVFALISGTTSNPTINLSSQPPMNQADLLSTIVFGHPASELSGDQQNYLSAQAIALLGSQGSRALRRIIGPEFSPDVITVHDSAQYGASLEAGKYINDDLYLRYRKNLGSEGGQNVGLEYQFSRHWSVESQVGDTRDTGMDIFYSLEWGK